MLLQSGIWCRFMLLLGEIRTTPMTLLLNPTARWATRALAGIASVLTNATHAYAQVFQGDGLNGGVEHGRGLQGIAQDTNVRQTVLDTMIAVLNFLTLVAVVVVIIAGITLIVSVGNEEGMTKAKKTIQYTLIGLAIVLFARLIVGFITVYIADKVA
jgi:hypothetical protein